MAYLEVGPRQGDPVILIHGSFDSIRTWTPAMKALHELNPSLHILAVDLRGHGDSSMPAASNCAPAPERCFRVGDFADDIVAFIKALKVQSVTLAGHSLGSFVTQEVALSHPELVARVVLVSTSTGSDAVSSEGREFLQTTIEGKWLRPLLAQGEQFPRDFYKLTPLRASSASLEVLTSEGFDPAVPDDELKASIQETGNVRLGTWIGVLANVFHSTKRLEDLRVPALVIWGVQDSVFHAVPDQQAVRDLLVRAALRHRTTSYWKQYGVRPLPASGQQESDIGHNAQWDAPQTIAADIDSFIKRGVPTHDLPHCRQAPNTAQIIVEKDRARVIRLGSAEDSLKKM
jgi:pimeloyl-ACP methyl ester carboxylesterase